jgi:hypothetical protein
MLFTSLIFGLFISLASTNISAQNGKDLKSLCEKYVIDCPISIDRSSNWIDILFVQKFLQEYLVQQTNSLLTKNKEGQILRVEFDGDKISVLINTNESIASEGTTVYAGSNQSQAEAEKELAREIARGKELEHKYLKQISLLLQPIFIRNKKIEINLTNYYAHRDYLLIFITARDLKTKYLNNKRSINYDAVWTEIINSLGKVDGFVADSKSEDRGQDSEKHSLLSKDRYENKISTLPNVIQNNGFVNKCFLTIEMTGDLGDREDFRIELLVKIHRRRASSNNWSEIFVGDSITDLTTISVIPVANKIMEALKK